MKNSINRSLGLEDDKDSLTEEQFQEYINLKLAAKGCPIFEKSAESAFMHLGESFLANLREKNRILADHLCPADQHIQQFLHGYYGDLIENKKELLIPTPTLTLERHGLARTLSLPPDGDQFTSDIVKSYRVHQGICHNPDKDRRTTKGVFHVVEGGFAVTADKKEVPRIAGLNLLRAALRPPEKLLHLPFTSSQEEQAAMFCSLLLRPVMCPAVPGFTLEKSVEVRFFAPGNLVSNLDFVESIFGNAGDPFLTENDARLDVEHWSGHTGCVILAPHLTTLKKVDLGLCHISDATERQKKDGMCWEDKDEIYNDGGAFKICCRNEQGVMVTLIADNYFGYCKKEVKTLISYASNLYGLCEEEHAGGAIAFPRFDLGEDFELSHYHQDVDHTFEEVAERLGTMIDVQPEGYGIDGTFADIYYLPESIHIGLRSQLIEWNYLGNKQTIKLQPQITYVLPSGYKINMEKRNDRWRLIGTNAEGTFCHKPCTVSGGGKSEISKPITDAMLSGPVMVSDFKLDFDRVEEIIGMDFANRYQNRTDPDARSRSLLSADRSLGSVVRLLTPNSEYTAEYNAWLETVPRRIRDLVLLVKRYYKPRWGNDWRERFSVDSINGHPGYELKYRKQKLQTSYLRVGFDADGSWRTFGLRKDFSAAIKIQTEDDISASVVVPAEALTGLYPNLNQPSYKFSTNCEFRLFQRPDEAIVRGYDKTAEADFSRTGHFFSNYEPLSRDVARAMVEDTILFDQFSEPIQEVIRTFSKAESPDFAVSTSHPRIVNGEPSKNPRYLQNRPDLEDHRTGYLAEMGARMFRRLSPGAPVNCPVNAVLPGRRNNPPDHKLGIRPLAVYNPIHYQELPEVFMEFMSSLTGKSPSTTGAGSEGALTKGPFNAMPTIIDLNNALVSYLLTGQGAFTTSAGYIGPKYRVDHDISMLIPETWCRMYVHEQQPEWLKENEYLEKLEDFQHKGQAVLQSRLGYRINEKFMNTFLGRMFADPSSVFNGEMLRPETQNLDDYVDGINNIVETQTRISKLYIEDRTVDLACPPLKALIHILAEGEFEGMDVHHADFRALFTREYLLESDWYKARIDAQEQVETKRLTASIAYLKDFLGRENYSEEAARLKIADRLARIEAQFENLGTPAHRESLWGTIGTDPAALG